MSSGQRRETHISRKYAAPEPQVMMRVTVVMRHYTDIIQSTGKTSVQLGYKPITSQTELLHQSHDVIRVYCYKMESVAASVNDEMVDRSQRKDYIAPIVLLDCDITDVRTHSNVKEQ